MEKRGTYEATPQPWPFCLWGTTQAHPVLTLMDEYGGVAHIIEDDHCYVLLLGSTSNGVFKETAWWFPEAVSALKTLPVPKHASQRHPPAIRYRS